MKRKAVDEGTNSPTKRQQQDADLEAQFLDLNPDDNPSHGSVNQEDNGSIFSEIKSSFSSPSSTTAAASLTPHTTAPTTLSTASRSRRFPSDLKTIPCPEPGCAKTFNRPARLTAHMRSHAGDRAFRCPEPGCAKTYLEEKHLRQHVKGSHSAERRYVCGQPGCAKAFLTATRLRRHGAVHDGADRFRCRAHPPCARTFRKRQTLQRHVRRDHLGLAAYACAQDGCAAGFDTAGALRRHVQREHGELQFWCDECAKGGGDGETGEAGDDDGDEGRRVGFTTLELLQAHMRREHLDCMFCGSKFRGQAALDQHMEMHHLASGVENRKTVACEWDGCGKKFTKRSNLNMHVRTAHENVRFICGEVDVADTGDIAGWTNTDGCGDGFISKQNLEDHIRYIHLRKERPQKAQKIVQQEPPHRSLLDRISGVTAEATYTIACAVEGCVAMFARHHDLQVHREKQHSSGVAGPDETGGLDDVEAGILSLVDMSTEPAEAGQPSLRFGHGSEPTTPGDFWIGASEHFESAYADPNDSWFQEEAEMRQLIGGGDCHDDLGGLLDPALL